MLQYIRLNLLKSQLEQELYIHAFSTVDGLPYSRIMDSVLSFVMVSVEPLVQYHRTDICEVLNQLHPFLLLEQYTHESCGRKGVSLNPAPIL